MQVFIGNDAVLVRRLKRIRRSTRWLDPLTAGSKLDLTLGFWEAVRNLRFIDKEVVC